jgi:enoyl-CoA hydratase/carnithine racemase
MSKRVGSPNSEDPDRERSSVDVEWRDQESIKVVRFHRSGRANALDVEMVQLLIAELSDIPDSTKVVILRSDGRVFSSGVDLDLLRELARSTSPAFVRGTVYGTFQELIRRISTCSIPVIAEVQGPALGAAADLVLSCDLCVASENSWIEETWIAVGLISALGGAFELTKAVGRHRALEMLLTARKITSDECLRLGIYQSVVPPEQLSSAALTLAREICTSDKSAIEACKSLVRQDSSPGLANYLATAQERQLQLIFSEQFRKDLEPSLERRMATIR